MNVFNIPTNATASFILTACATRRWEWPG